MVFSVLKPKWSIKQYLSEVIDLECVVTSVWWTQVPTHLFLTQKLLQQEKKRWTRIRGVELKLKWEGRREREASKLVEGSLYRSRSSLNEGWRWKNERLNVEDKRGNWRSGSCLQRWLTNKDTSHYQRGHKRERPILFKFTLWLPIFATSNPNHHFVDSGSWRDFSTMISGHPHIFLRVRYPRFLRFLRFSTAFRNFALESSFWYVSAAFPFFLALTWKLLNSTYIFDRTQQNSKLRAVFSR